MALFSNTNEVQNHFFRLAQTIINELLRKFKKDRNLAEKLGDWELADKESKFLIELEMNPNAWRIMNVEYDAPDELQELLKQHNIDFRVVDKDGTFVVHAKDVPEINKIFYDYFKGTKHGYTFNDEGVLNSLEDLKDGHDDNDRSDDDRNESDENSYSDYDEEYKEEIPSEKLSSEYGEDDKKKGSSQDADTNSHSSMYDDYYNEDSSDNNLKPNSENGYDAQEQNPWEDSNDTEPYDTWPAWNDDEKDDKWAENYTEQPVQTTPETQDDYRNDWDDEEEYSNNPINNDFGYENNQANEAPIQDNQTQNIPQDDPYIKVVMQDENGDTYTKYCWLVQGDEHTQDQNSYNDILDTSELDGNNGSIDYSSYGRDESYSEYREAPIDDAMRVVVDNNDPSKFTVNVNNDTYDYFQKTCNEYSNAPMAQMSVQIDDKVLATLQPGYNYYVKELDIEAPSNSQVYQHPFQNPVQQSMYQNAQPAMVAPAIQQPVQQPTVGFGNTYSSETTVTFTAPAQMTAMSSNPELPKMAQMFQANQISGNNALQISPAHNYSLGEGNRAPAVINIERFKQDAGLRNHDALMNAAFDATHIKDGYDESNLKKTFQNKELGMAKSLGDTFIGAGHNTYLMKQGALIQQSLTQTDISLLNECIGPGKIDFSTKEGIISSVKTLKDFSIENSIIHKRGTQGLGAYYATDRNKELVSSLYGKNASKTLLENTGEGIDPITLRENLIADIRAKINDKVKRGIIKPGKFTDKDISDCADHILKSAGHVSKAATDIDRFNNKRSGSLMRSVSRITGLDDEQNMGMLINASRTMETGLNFANAAATARANLLELRIQHLSKQAANYDKIQKSIEAAARGEKPYTSKYLKRIADKKKKVLSKRGKLLDKHQKTKKATKKLNTAAEKLKMPQKKIKETGVKIAKAATKKIAKELSKTAVGKAIVAKTAAMAKTAAAVSSYLANLLTGVSEIATIAVIVIVIIILVLLALGCIISFILAVLGTILLTMVGFFTGDSSDSPTTIMYDENGTILFEDSPMGRVYKALEKNEEDWIKSLIDGIYDPDYPPYISDIEEYIDLSGTALGGGGSYSMNWENAKIVWDVLKENGFSDYAAAGCLGNLARESGCNPTAFRNAADKGYGIAQWTDYKSTTNWTQMRQQMAAHGYAEDDLIGQTYCMIEEWVKLWYNGDNKSKGVQANNMADYKQFPYSTVEEAVFDWCYGAEKPAESTAGMDVRNAAALKAYNMFSPDGENYGEWDDNADVNSDADNDNANETESEDTSTETETTGTRQISISNNEASEDETNTNNSQNTAKSEADDSGNEKHTEENLEEGELSLSDIANGTTPRSAGGGNVNLFKRKPLKIEAFAPLCLGTSYASDGVVGPIPFTGAPAEAYKHIRIIDGGSELNFLDQEGKTGVKSNIKLITSMYNVANTDLENNSDEYDDAEMVSVIEAADSGNWFKAAATLFMNTASNVFKDITKGISEVFSGIEKTKRNNAAITYSHMLFNASHQVGFSLKMEKLPTLHGTGDGGESLCTGNESQSVPLSAHNEHKGYGCMSYSGFKFNHTDRDKVFYNDTESAGVEPAANVDDDEYFCNVPNVSKSELDEAMEHWSECWEIEEGETQTSSSGSEDSDIPSYITDINSSAIGYSVGGTSEKICLIIYTDHDTGDDEDDDEEWTYTEYWLTHDCKGHHKGYYCGGHLKLIVIGTIMTASKDEMEGNYKKYYNKVTDNNKYLRGDAVKIDKEKARHASDIFDLDMAITHHPSTVSPDFEGWNGANIENAITLISENWETVYGIKEPEYKDLLASAAAQGSATALTEEQIEEIMDNVKEILGDDPDRIDRINALKTALFYVGKISYSQAHHGNALKVGGQNDCSGYASLVNEKALKGAIYTTGSFWDSFKRSGRIHPFSDGGIKPGDIILHYDGAIADCSGDHALVYVGVIDGEIKSADCTGSGTWYRHREDSYYQNAYYLDLTGMY